MKTRIISGVVMALIVAAVITLGVLVSPVFITGFIAFLAGMAVIELLKNVVKIESKAALISAGIYSVLNVFALNSDICVKLSNIVSYKYGMMSYYSGLTQFMFSILLGVAFFITAAVICLKNQGKFSLAQILTFTAFPIVLSFAFSCLDIIINSEHGIFYLFLLLNFSSICDMGAYFTGVTIGKHKLCPTISPNKTVEGAVGGILSSVIVTVILVFAFSLSEKLIAAIIVTVLFCVLGMIGDLFASSVKRAAEIKDYGDLIPGHGGILDRFDSIIMIAPLFYILFCLGAI